MIEVLTKPTAADPPAVWFDIENPPQVQYSSRSASVRSGRTEDLVTARDYGST